MSWTGWDPFTHLYTMPAYGFTPSGKLSFVLVDILIFVNSLAPSNADQEKKIETWEAIYKGLLTPKF